MEKINMKTLKIIFLVFNLIFVSCGNGPETKKQREIIVKEIEKEVNEDPTPISNESEEKQEEEKEEEKEIVVVEEPEPIVIPDTIEENVIISNFRLSLGRNQTLKLKIKNAFLETYVPKNRQRRVKDFSNGKRCNVMYTEKEIKRINFDTRTLTRYFDIFIDGRKLTPIPYRDGFLYLNYIHYFSTVELKLKSKYLETFLVGIHHQVSTGHACRKEGTLGKIGKHPRDLFEYDYEPVSKLKKLHYQLYVEEVIEN